MTFFSTSCARCDAMWVARMTLEYMTRLCTIDAVSLKIVMFTNADRGAHNSESTLNQRGAWV